MKIRFCRTRVGAVRVAAVSVVDARAVTLCALLFLCGASKAHASQATGTLAGRVTDQFGAVVVSARVTVEGAGGLERKADADGEGRYAFNGLPPGTYSVRVEARGFAPFERAGVEVVAGRKNELDAQLAVGLERQEVTVGEGEGLSAEAGRNASALTLRESELEALPEDPEDLAAALQALSGAPVGPSGGQVLVDGFLNTGEPLPNRSSIREVRINQNPFSAENDRIGFGQIQVITQPGAEKLRGQAYFNFNDESLNSRYPFVARRESFQIRNPGGNLGGPLVPGRASYFLSLDRRETDDLAVVNALVLDEELNVVPFVAAVRVPRRHWSASARFDFLLGKSHTLAARYNYYRNRIENAGAGGVSLPERALSITLPIHTIQLTETFVIGPRAFNEFRLQYIGEDEFDEPVSTRPAVNVVGAFLGGGSPGGRARNPEGRLTLQDSVLWTAGAHTLRAGARLRRTTIEDISPDDFNGTYTFAGGLAPQLDAGGNPSRDEGGQIILAPVTSIERYRRTLLFQRRGLSPAEIRARGGGATQFILGGGNALAEASQVDFGAYLQDDWRVRDNVTLSLGLRYEFQTNIRKNLNLAPRLALAWSPDFKGGAKAGQPRTVVRAGFGVFFDRFNENQVLIANKYAASDFFRFVSSDATVLDSFPVPPTVGVLAAVSSASRAVFRAARDLREPYMLQAAFAFERQLPLKTTFTATYVAARTLHALRARNVNAPAFKTGASAFGARPLGDIGNVYQYESSGRLNQNQLILTANSRLDRRVSFYVNYNLNKASGDTESVGSFPADGNDLRAEYGRSSFDVRHTFSAGGTFDLPLAVRLSPLVFASSGRPFNITNGVDTNGDSLFADRPAFAEDLTMPGVRLTPFGAFDINPRPGLRIIPRNYGEGPGYFVFNLSVTRTFVIGGAAPAAARARGADGVGVEDRRRFTLGVRVLNLFNRVNLDVPVGNLGSPLFGRSTATAGGFGAISGGHPAAGNRRVDALLRFEF
jgi:hypothetical protein